MALDVGPSDNSRTGGGEEPAGPHRFEETLQGHLVTVDPGQSRLGVSALLVPRPVVAGTTGVAVTATEKSQPVTAGQRIATHPLEGAVARDDFDSRFERRIVMFQVGVLSADVGRDDRVGAAVVSVEIPDVVQFGRLVHRFGCFGRGVAVNGLVVTPEVDIVVSSVPGFARPLVSRDRDEPSRLVELQFDILLCDEILFVQHVGVSLESGELDAGHITGVLEEPGELLTVDQLSSVWVGPEEPLFSNVFDHASRVAGSLDPGIVVPGCQSHHAGLFTGCPVDPSGSGVGFGERQRVVLQCHSIPVEHHGAAVPVGRVSPGVLGLDQDPKRFTHGQLRRNDHDQFHRFATDNSQHRRLHDGLDTLSTVDGDGKDASLFTKGLGSRTRTAAGGVSQYDRDLCSAGQSPGSDLELESLHAHGSRCHIDTSRGSHRGVFSSSRIVKLGHSPVRVGVGAHADRGVPGESIFSGLESQCPAAAASGDDIGGGFDGGRENRLAHGCVSIGALVLYPATLLMERPTGSPCTAVFDLLIRTHHGRQSTESPAGSLEATVPR